MGVKEISTIVKTVCTAVAATVVAVCLIMLTKNANQTMASFREDVSYIKNDFHNMNGKVDKMSDKFDKIFSEENITKFKNSLNRLDSITEKIDSRVLTSENICRVSDSLSTVNSATEKVRTVGNWFSFAWHMMAG